MIIPNTVTKNQSLMHVLKKAHGLMESDNIEKQRNNQEHIGEIFSRGKDILFRDVDLEGIHGEWTYVNRAHNKRQVILHCHGGGFSTGSTTYARSITSRLADNTNMRVLSFDYRLAPDYQYPAALEDAMKAWNHLMLLGYGARDVIITGDSAGGNLALALTLKIKEEHRLPPRAVFLMSPWTDLTNSGESFETKKDVDPVLDEAYIEKMKTAYVPEGEDLKNPFISPLYGDYKNFPPVYIQVGDNEVLLDDAVRLRNKLKEEGVQVRLDIYEGMWHVFQMSPFKTAEEAMDKAAEFIISQMVRS